MIDKKELMMLAEAQLKRDNSPNEHSCCALCCAPNGLVGPPAWLANCKDIVNGFDDSDYKGKT
ncbi:MAG TPA: hypothetical protein VMW72_21955 [Sedimentisphaerales bacterium]|nr:hypothetical protein [Sedimentisphaerales bacterium]